MAVESPISGWRIGEGRRDVGGWRSEAIVDQGWRLRVKVKEFRNRSGERINSRLPPPPLHAPLDSSLRVGFLSQRKGEGVGMVNIFRLKIA